VNKKDKNIKFKQESDLIICAAFNVYNLLGNGFLEKVYENALCLELARLHVKCEKQKQTFVYFRDEVVGEYFADLLVENQIIVEIKAVQNISPIHEAQLLHYLKATKLQVGYLLNFGNEKKLYFKRFVN